MLDHAAVSHVSCDACCSKGVTAKSGGESGHLRLALDHLPDFHTVHLVLGEAGNSARSGAEEGSLAVFSDAGSIQMSVEILFRQVVDRHLVKLAALLVEAQPPALSELVVVFNAHPDHRSNACQAKAITVMRARSGNSTYDIKDQLIQEASAPNGGYPICFVCARAGDHRICTE